MKARPGTTADAVDVRICLACQSLRDLLPKAMARSARSAWSGPAYVLQYCPAPILVACRPSLAGWWSLRPHALQLRGR
jgi:hypothetical protein